MHSMPTLQRASSFPLLLRRSPCPVPERHEREAPEPCAGAGDSEAWNHVPPPALSLFLCSALWGRESEFFLLLPRFSMPPHSQTRKKEQRERSQHRIALFPVVLSHQAVPCALFCSLERYRLDLPEASRGKGKRETRRSRRHDRRFLSTSGSFPFSRRRRFVRSILFPSLSLSHTHTHLNDASRSCSSPRKAMADGRCLRRCGWHGRGLLRVSVVSGVNVLPCPLV